MLHIRRDSRGVVKCVVFVLLLLFVPQSEVFGRGMTESQLAKLDPATEATSVLLETIKQLLKNDQIEEAEPFLEELVSRLEGDEERKTQQTLAFSLYQLAHVQMKLGDFGRGARSFAAFVERFPADPQNSSARVLAAQCLTMLQKWPEVEELVESVLRDRRADKELKVAANQLLAESRYQQEKWAEAITPLGALFRSATKDSVRAGAAVMLVTCYVRVNDFENLFKFLPHCDHSARHDVGLNVALLEAGDAHYNAGEYQKALLLYRLVLLRGELIDHHEQRIKDLRASMQPFKAGGGMSLSQFKERQLKQQQLLDRLVRSYEVIQGFQDYDMDVSLRMAQCYNDLGRNWPAHAIYTRIFSENPQSTLADQARFSAFGVMLDEREWALAIQEGYGYLDVPQRGEYVDDVSLNLMQVHMEQRQFDLAYAMGERGLKLSPAHKYIDQVRYLMGYIRFTQFDYEEALATFSEVLEKWPQSRYYESAEYWRSMTLLFLGRFPDAVVAFNAYLTNPKYDPRVYVEDASYRLGVAQYGAERYAESEQTFIDFVDLYPESHLISEAYAMLGDISGADGDMEQALDYFAKARETALNINQVNYPLFRAAEALQKLERYEDLIALMDTYLKEYGEKGDFAHAVNWQGKAYKALDQYPRALDAWFSVIDQFGNNADLAGIDLIVNSVVDDYAGEDWTAYREVILEKLTTRLAGAGERGEKTLELHYQTAFARILKDEARTPYVDAVVQMRNVPAAGSGALVLMAREGVKRKQYELVHAAYDRFVSTFEVSNNMLYIMLANLDALVADENFDDAVDLSDEILMKFGYASKSVGWARKRRGDIYRMQGKYELAIEAYKEVLAIREWRGPLTPEALFCSGVCKMELEQIEEAYAYFQRIYVLYEDYTEWVAPAYAKSVACLERLGGREQEIIKTYREMLSIEKVAATEEGQAAAKRLEQLAPAGGAQ